MTKVREKKKKSRTEHVTVNELKIYLFVGGTVRNSRIYIYKIIRLGICLEIHILDMKFIYVY